MSKDLSTTPDVSVVVPTMNAGEMLSRTLESVQPAMGSLSFELIIVNNGAPPADVRSTLPSSDAIVIDNPINVGYAPACNQGAARASGRYILLLNSDCSLPSQSMERLVNVANSDAAAAAWQPLIMSEDGERVDSAGSAFSQTGFLVHALEEPATSDELISIFAAKGACLLFRTDVFRHIGGFIDEYFAYFEDTDLCWKARLAGYEVRLVLPIRVNHVVGATTSRYFKPSEIDFMSFRNRLHCILSNASILTLLRVLPLHVAACIVTSMAFLLRGDRASASAVGRATVWPLHNIGRVRRSRQQAQSLRQVKDKEILYRPDLYQRMSVKMAVWLLFQYLPRWGAKEASDQQQRTAQHA